MDLDFWLGDWTCTDPADGSVGTNSIRRILGDKVVEETFTITDAQGTTLNGRSWSVLDPARGWVQTWVDDSGAYLDFVGTLTDEGPVFARPGARMVFRDITPDAFQWDWEKETPAGFELAWRLFYVRRLSARARGGS